LTTGSRGGGWCLCLVSIVQRVCGNAPQLLKAKQISSSLRNDSRLIAGINHTTRHGQSGRRVSIWVKRRADLDRTRAFVNGAEVETLLGRGVLVSWRSLPEEAVIEIMQPHTLPENPVAPPDAPTDWSGISPHAYPDDPELIAQAKRAMQDAARRS